MDINDLLRGNLPDELLDQLTQQIGGVEKEKTSAAASGVITSMIAALNKNSNDPQGASALANALDRDHDGSIFEDLVGMVAGRKQPQNTNMLNGAGIIKHVLGNKSGNIIDMVSKMSGLESEQSGSLLKTLAPIIMGALGQQKKKENLDAGGLSDFLTKTVRGQESKNAQMGLIERLLDQDGDGSVIDDIANIGMKTLGNFFKRRG